MKTAMQQFKDEIVKTDFLSENQKGILAVVAMKFIELEKQQIIDAYERAITTHGFSQLEYDSRKTSSANYYSQTFTNNS